MPLDRDSGTAQVIAFVTAGAIFLGAIGAVLLASQQAGGDHASADVARQEIRASSLADLLVGSPGVGWASGPDQIARLGLGAANGSGLEPDSLEALRGALYSASANGKVDYQEAKASLGLDPAGSQQFHIRVYPVGMDSVYDASLSGLRTAYIGDWSSLASITLPLGTPTNQLESQANVRLNLSMVAGTVLERQALDQLGLDFNDRVYITAGYPTILVDLPSPLPDAPLLTVLNVPLLEGDVYPDHKKYLDAVLPGRLARYDVLVVGSGVDQQTLTGNAVKSAIRDWTLAGGTLVVLGSDKQNFQWLQPLFSVGVATVNGAVTAPDVSHPLLKEPNELAWTSYSTQGRAWDIKDTGSGAHYNDFSHVVVQGGEDVLAVSKDGAFGEGRILLTSYMPRTFAATLGLQEISNFFENIALYADRSHLYLDYGPDIPAGTAVAVAVRESWLWDELYGQVPVRIEVHAWD